MRMPCRSQATIRNVTSVKRSIADLPGVRCRALRDPPGGNADAWPFAQPERRYVGTVREVRHTCQGSGVSASDSLTKSVSGSPEL
jgi:hypothetical protein